MSTASEWDELRRKVIRRDQGKCQAACGRTDGLTVHHIIPRAEGGADDPANLVTLCELCHDEIEDTDIRSIEGIHAYAPRWHSAVPWYLTVPIRKASTQKAKKPTPGRRPNIKPKQCLLCRTVFVPHLGFFEYCSTTCRAADAEARTHEYERQYLAWIKGKSLNGPTTESVLAELRLDRFGDTDNG